MLYKLRNIEYLLLQAKNIKIKDNFFKKKTNGFIRH